MLMTCRLMFEEGVEDPMGESRHRSEPIKMGITRYGVMWRGVFRPMVSLNTNNCSHGWASECHCPSSNVHHFPLEGYEKL